MFSSNTSQVSGSTDSTPFNYVTMLLPGNGTNGAQNITPIDSASGYTIFTNGTAINQGTFSPYGTLWSNYFDGSGDYLSIADNAALDIPGDFTIEFWANVDSGNTDRAGIIGHRDQSTFNDGIDWVIRVETAAGRIGFGYDSAGNYYDMGSYVVGEWAHYAITRSGTTIRTFKNGAEVATATSSGTWSSSAPLLIGKNVDGYDYKGFLSNARLVKGTALYTSGFTPSTTPLTAVSGTSLLTCQSNRFIDNSANNFAITASGDVSVQRFTPFAPTAAYSTSTIGGSGFFPGTGSFSTEVWPEPPAGAFTVELWVNFKPAPSGYLFASSNDGGGLQAGPGIYVTSSNQIGVWFFYFDINFGAYSAAPNAWHHVVLVRNSANLTALFIDGVRRNVATISGAFDKTDAVIGSTFADKPWAGPIFNNGYLSDVRVANTNLYNPASTTITVPTAPLTAVGGTTFLCSFQNAGIIDNSMMNVLRTFGNAQISTAVSRFGGGSIAFDGAGDYLSVPDSPLLQGFADFTIEFYLNLNSVVNATCPLTKGWISGLYAPWLFYVNGTNLVFYASSNNSSWDVANNALITPLVAGQWYYIAVSRSGSSLRLFVNGLLTTTVTSGAVLMTNSTALAVGAGANGANAINGYIDDLRITRAARYTASFTPPTLPFPTF